MISVISLVQISFCFGVKADLAGLIWLKLGLGWFRLSWIELYWIRLCLLGDVWFSWVGLVWIPL